MKIKKIALLFIALLACVQVSNAQVSGLHVGYCNGEVRTTGTIGSAEKNIWVSGAVYIPADKMNVYAGNHIDSIKAGLASSLNVDSLRVWVRTSLEGEDLASGAINKTVAPALAKGWNQIALDKPYQIPRQTGLYIGYSFHQKGSAYGLSILPAATANGLFVKIGDSGWSDRGNEGTLCVEALVFGDNLPKYNIELDSLETQPYYIIDKGTLDIDAKVKNIATNTISGFDAQCKIEGLDEVYTAHIDKSISYGETADVHFTIHPAIENTDPSVRHIQVTLANIKEGEDENLLDNVLTDSFEVVAHDYTRTVLVEEFTSEACVNCPRVAGQLADVLARKDVNATAICHHSGYESDWLTIPSDNDYTWFYNLGGSTFAPGLMIDRKVSPYWSNNASASPIYSPSSADEIAYMIQKEMEQTAFVNLNIKADIDSVTANEIHVHVTGERSKTDFTKNPPRIVVSLMEDNISPHNQANSSADFLHHHVNRALNSTWGDVIEWDGDKYSYDCNFTLRNDYVRDNLSITAYIWDYDGTNAADCSVANAASIPFKEVTTDIAKVNVKATKKADNICYNLSGQRINRPFKGIYLMNGKKYVAN